MKRCAVLFAIILAIAVFELHVAMIRRPLLKETGIESYRDYDSGEDLIAYRYAVDGIDCVAVLRDDAEVIEYRAYLSKFGKWE
jgi:hypothetical protein